MHTNSLISLMQHHDKFWTMMRSSLVSSLLISSVKRLSVHDTHTHTRARAHTNVQQVVHVFM